MTTKKDDARAILRELAGLEGDMRELLLLPLPRDPESRALLEELQQRSERFLREDLQRVRNIFQKMLKE